MLILTVDSWKYLENLKLNLDLKHKIELNLLNVSLSWQIWMLIFFDLFTTKCSWWLMKKVLKTAIYASNQGYIRTRKLSVIRVIATCLQRSWGKMLGITINTNITEVYVNILNELFAWKCFKNVHESFCDWSVEIN